MDNKRVDEQDGRVTFSFAGSQIGEILLAVTSIRRMAKLPYLW
ncbi:hypothetical protein ACFLW6_04940 [Chloroflexota bacterium]